jgi:hypothetical protein
MPFNYLLTNLLVDVPEAVGAIFLDAEGEAVDWVTRHDDPYDLKIEGAYHSIFKRQIEIVSGAIRHYTMECDRLVSLTHALPDGYYLVLVLDRKGRTGRALHHLSPGRRGRREGNRLRPAFGPGFVRSEPSQPDCMRSTHGRNIHEEAQTRSLHDAHRVH